MATGRENSIDEQYFFSLNLPTIRANLRRLVGTEEVELNDHQFMMNLRNSVWNDFDDKLGDRIRQREVNAIVICLDLPCRSSS